MKFNLKKVFFSFFPARMRRQVRELYSSSVILIFAESMFTIFEPVFLYTMFIRYFDLKTTLELVLVFYLIIYIFYLLLLPLAAKFARKIGLENSILIGVVMIILLYFSFFNMEKYLWLGAITSVFFYILAKAFYWPAYHEQFASFSRNGQEGREISNLAALETLVSIIGPLLGGLFLKFYGFNTLFATSAFLMIVSILPLLATPEKKLPAISFKYKEAFANLWLKKNRRRFYALLGYGEELLVLVIWPIFIYVVVEDYLGLGVLTAASTMLTALVYILVGRIADKNDRKIVIRYGSIFYYFSWLARLLTHTVFGVFLIDIYSRIAKQAIAVPILATTYETAQDNSVIKEIVFYEMALVVGKILAAILCLVILQFFAPGWNSMFIIAGLFSLLYLLF